jgi:hypothetical protein
MEPRNSYKPPYFRKNVQSYLQYAATILIRAIKAIGTARKKLPLTVLRISTCATAKDSKFTLSDAAGKKARYNTMRLLNLDFSYFKSYHWTTNVDMA